MEELSETTPHQTQQPVVVHQTHAERVAALTEAEMADARNTNPYMSPAGISSENNNNDDDRHSSPQSSQSRKRVRAPTNSDENDRTLDEALATMKEWADVIPNQETARAAIEKIETLGEKFWNDFRARFVCLGLEPSQMAIAYFKYHVATMEAKAPLKKHLYMLTGFGLSQELIMGSYSPNSGLSAAMM